MKYPLNFCVRIFLAFSCVFSTLLHAEDYGFDRLFTSDKERQELQILRDAASVVIIEEDPVEYDEIVFSRNMQALTVDGFLYRKDGKHAVWINQQENYQHNTPSFTPWQIDQINVQSKKVSISIPLEDVEFSLKVGETYQPKEENGFDIISPVYDIAISKALSRQ